MCVCMGVCVREESTYKRGIHRAVTECMKEQNRTVHEPHTFALTHRRGSMEYSVDTLKQCTFGLRFPPDLHSDVLCALCPPRSKRGSRHRPRKLHGTYGHTHVHAQLRLDAFLHS